jgi:hypothetical protein
MMDVPKPVPLRSLGEALGGYIQLPRLIDKVRLLAQGQLPQPYAAKVLNPRLTLGGRFFFFTELNVEALRRVILSNRTDDEVLAWMQEPAKDMLLRFYRERFISTTTLHVIVSSTEPALIRG